jgi:hypothetical protein
MNRLGDVNRLITSIGVRETEWEGIGSYIIIFSEATFLGVYLGIVRQPLAPNFALWIVGSSRSARVSRCLVIADEGV